MANEIDKIIIKNMNVSPFMKLFWEQQKELYSKGSSARYQPMIIRFALSLSPKSSKANSESRSSKVLYPALEHFKIIKVQYDHLVDSVVMYMFFYNDSGKGKTM